MSEECSLCKNEDVSLNPKYLQKNPDMEQESTKSSKPSPKVSFRINERPHFKTVRWTIPEKDT